MRGLMPAMLIGLGIYILRGYIFKPREEENKWPDFDSARPARMFTSEKGTGEIETTDYSRGAQAGGWRNR